MKRHRHRECQQGQRGFTLIEVLVSLLVFSFGVLALVGLQGAAIRFAGDAQQRADATFLADQVLGRMLISDSSTVATFAHYPTGTRCAPSGSASTNAMVLEWLDQVKNVLPQSPEASTEQIIVNTATNQVTVKICWRNGAGLAHELVVSNQVQWQ